MKTPTGNDLASPSLAVQPITVATGLHRFLRTVPFALGNLEIHTGELVFLKGDPYRVVEQVENLDSGAVWVELKGVENHRYRSIRREVLAEALAAGL